MQACEVCGWDTRAGTRVCASCGATQESRDTAGEAVLAGVLQQARSMSGDAGQAPEDTPRATTSRRPRSSQRDEDGREQVVLREIEPGRDEPERPRRPEPASVTASLLEAFQPQPEPGSAAVAPSLAPDEPRRDAIPNLRTADADEVTDEDALGVVDGPPVADPVEPMVDTDRLDAVAPPTAHGHARVADGRPAQADAAATPTETPADPDAHSGQPPDAWASPDDTGPITDRFANIPTVPMDVAPGVSSDLSADAQTLDRAGTARSASAPAEADADDVGTTPPTDDDGAASARAPDDAGTGATPAAAGTGEGAAAAPTTTGTGVGTTDTPASRAARSEDGTWTAVAQFTLLFIGVLCVFQVVVLLVVNQFLSQAQTQVAVAADMLAAHAKVATVMLPALVGGAAAAAAFAAWRVHTDPQQYDDALLRRRVLGLPVAIWGVIVATAVLLLIVLFGTSATVAEAQRMTLWAVGACTLLGVACVAAPRGLAAPDPALDADEAPTEASHR